MSIENHREKREIPKKDLLIASTNIIDQIGTVRTGEKKRMQDATWDDDAAGLRFSLQSHTIKSLGRNLFTTFFLKTYTQFSHDPFEYYRYNSEGDLDQCDDDWQALEEQDPAYDRALKVQNYLASALPPKNPDIEQPFHDLVASTVLGDPWFQQRARRIGHSILTQNPEKAIRRLAQRTHAKEPLLTEIEIREAIARLVSE